MEDNEVIYMLNVRAESPELAGKVMHAAGALGAYEIRFSAIEEGRRRPVRQKELARILLGATEPEPHKRCESPRSEPSEILEAIRFTLGVVKRAVWGRVRR